MSEKDEKEKKSDEESRPAPEKSWLEMESIRGDGKRRDDEEEVSRTRRPQN